MTVPDFTIEGDPELVRRRAVELEAVATELDRTGESLARVTTDGWTGRAAEAFRAAYEGRPRSWSEAADAFASASRALSTYASVLASAQSTTAAAAAAFDRGQALSADARREHALDLAAHRRTANEAALVGVWTTTPAPVFVDRGADLCRQALTDLDSARAAVHVAVNQAVRRIDAACEHAPDAPTFITPVADFADGARDAAVDLWHLVEVTSPAVWTPHKVERARHADADAELMWWQVKALMGHRAHDPTTAAAAMLIDGLRLNDFADRGAHTAGTLVPDVVLGAVTGGSGPALRSASRLPRALDVKPRPGAGGRLTPPHPGPALPAVPAPSWDHDQTPPARPTALTVPDRYADLPVQEVASGQRGAWNLDLYEPDPSTVYAVDDQQLFVTDPHGRVEHVEADLEYRTPDQADTHRNDYQQRLAGGEHRLTTDHGGHLVAASLGGPGEPINLVAMDAALNGTSTHGQTWGTLEHEWRALLHREPPADIRISIDVDYPVGSTRPESLWVRYSVDGGTEILRRFSQ